MINLKELKPAYKVTRSEDHIYTIDTGERKVIVPGTTGILDIVGSKDKTNRLMGWAKKQALLKVADHIREYSGKPLTVDEAWIEAVRKSAWKRDKEKLKEAGDKGTSIHDAIEEDTYGRSPVITKDIEIGFENYLTWKKNSGVKILMGDTYVGSLTHLFGGAADAFGENSKGVGLVDYKTGNYLHDENALQAGGAYTTAAEETFPGLRLNWALIVRFGKEKLGDIEERWVNIPHAKASFLSALDLHYKMKGPLWAEGEI
jgi:hypothetical protein